MIRALLLAVLLAVSSPADHDGRQFVASPVPSDAQPVIRARIRTYRTRPAPKTQRNVYVLKRRILKCDSFSPRPALMRNRRAQVLSPEQSAGRVQGQLGLG